jgi:hypothetical protein
MNERRRFGMTGLTVSVGLFMFALLVFPIISSNVNGEDTGEHEYTFFRVPFEAGDTFDYDMDISKMVQTIIDEEGSESAVYEITFSESRITVSDPEKLTVGGTEIETFVLLKEMEMGYTIIDDEQQVRTEMEMTIEVRECISMSNFLTVGSEETVKQRITMTFGDDMGSYTSVIETETVTEDQYLDADLEGSMKMEVGEIWSSTVKYDSTVTERSRYKYDTEPFSEWESSSFEENVIDTITFEIVSVKDIEVPAGKFEVLEKTSESAGGYEMECEYLDQFGMMVRCETMFEGEPEIIMILTDFQMKNREDSDGDGVIDIRDAFPTDKAASVDSDNDGHPDSWNEGMTEEDSTTSLELDRFPDDPDRWNDTDDSPFGPVMLFAGILLVMSSFVAFIGFCRKR